MWFRVESVLIGMAIVGGMLLALEAGRRAGLRWPRDERERTSAASSVIETSVFGLMGLMLAFAFNGAAARHDSRHMLVSAEANSIGTAHLRLDLLPPGARDELRGMFREYLDARLRVLRAVGGVRNALAEQERLATVRDGIWTRVVAECGRDARTSTGILLIPAVNEMFDRGDESVAAALLHIPHVVLAFLILIAHVSAALAGFSLATARRRCWFHQIVFAVVFAATVFITVNLEYPRLGFLDNSRDDLPMTNLRATMN